MIEIKGTVCNVKIIADSINESGNRLTTFELEYPRLIHSEILTHKMLCSNSASSRAIPFPKMLEQLTAKPARFGKNKSGMQDEGISFDAKVKGTWGESKISPEEAWNDAKDSAIYMAKNFHEAGYHKQITGRLTEPFQMMKTVISGTEWPNFFWLRNDSAADPTLHELARCMQEARDESVPQLLKAGEWHLPYVDYFQEVVGYDGEDNSVLGKRQFYVGILQSHSGNADNNFDLLTIDQAIKVSCARTAAVSFRNEDYGLEKCLEVYARLIGDERKHASAMQHCATPMGKQVENIGTHMTRKDYINIPSDPSSWEKGISHSDRNRKLWSAQYCGFIMHRKTIPGENYVNG